MKVACGVAMGLFMHAGSDMQTQAVTGAYAFLMPHMSTAGYGKKGGKSGGSGEEESEDVK